MRFLLILIFACAFVLFLETDAQAPEFSGNTCNEEGANCQTDDDWVYGWCEAAVEAGVFKRHGGSVHSAWRRWRPASA